jgi:hypothetical protein
MNNIHIQIERKENENYIPEFPFMFVSGCDLYMTIYDSSIKKYKVIRLSNGYVQTNFEGNSIDELLDCINDGSNTLMDVSIVAKELE